MFDGENVQHALEEDDSLGLAIGLGLEPSEFDTFLEFIPRPSDSFSSDFEPIFAEHPVVFPFENGPSLLDRSLSQTVPPPQSSHRPIARGKRSHLSQRATQILRHWLKCRSDDPYPTRQEKASLAQETGLSVAQVSTWFANARRRRKPSIPSGSGHAITESIELLPESRVTYDEWSSLSPLERWENSPPEIEPAPLKAIVDAVSSAESDDQLKGTSGPSYLASGDRQKSDSLAERDAHSVVSSNASGSGLSATSGSSTHSLASSHSGGSFNRFYVHEPPRRRRRRRKTLRSAKASEERPFQCTFCADTFRTKYDWTRHEKTLHLPLDKFTCAPFGPVYCSPVDGAEHCVFCDESFPSVTHVESHQFSSCQQKPLGLRTFYRKDHLFQHLRLIHGVCRMTSAMNTWKSQAENINSRCGFCGQKFTMWSERNDHIAQHFRDGALMKDWRGCRGLDPSVALAVENAMPPYLIGMESTGMNPFKASCLVDNRETDGLDNGSTGNTNPTPFEYLTARLSDFVQRARSSGQIVTDEMLQKEARCIVYSDDDPWNQTPADNSEWLKLFKQGVGLGVASDPVQTRPSDSSTCEDDIFCLPWSEEQWAPFSSNVGGVSYDILDMNSTCMTCSWQSPECLVEFRRHVENHTLR